jgi:hypothetical protein
MEAELRYRDRKVVPCPLCEKREVDEKQILQHVWRQHVGGFCWCGDITPMDLASWVSHVGECGGLDAHVLSGLLFGQVRIKGGRSG